MGLEKDVFLFLSDYGHVQAIKDQSDKYCHIDKGQDMTKKTVMAVYKFTLSLDIAQLCEEYAKLGNSILHSPSDAWQIFHQVVFKVIQRMKWLPGMTSTTQLLLMLRLSALPDLPGYTMSHLSDLPKYNDSPRFVAYTGVVCGMGMKEKYTESACFHCSNSSCITRQSGDKYIRMHITGYSEAMTVRGNLTCSSCEAALSEDIAFRILSEKLLVNMVPISALACCHGDYLINKPVRYQSLPVMLRGAELCEKVQLGLEYTVIGIPVHVTEIIDGRTAIKTTLEANNVYLSDSSLIAAATPTAIPSSLTDILEASSYSPWTFAATLAYSFAAELFPPGIYHRLKLVLLLSVITARSRNKGSLLNVLAHGREAHHNRKLMEYASQFVSRRISHCSSMDIIGTAKKDWVDAGSVPLSSGGVCMIDNISSWKNETRETLLKVLEDHVVTIRSKQVLESRVTHPLSTTIWTISDASNTDIHQWSARNKDIEEFGGIPRHLVDHLGIVTVTDPPTQDNEELVCNVLTDHVLQTAMGKSTIAPLIKDDYEKLFMWCSKINTVLSPSAESMLRGYYLASRRARGTKFQTATTIPNTAMDTLITLALGHASLSFRQEAVEADAVLAIMVYEEGLLSRTGYSPLELLQTPHVKSEDISEYIGKTFDYQMRRFQETVNGFIKNYVTMDTEDVHSLPAGLYPSLPEE